MKRKGLHDELGEDVYAIVQTPRGSAFYVRLDHVTAETFREGDRVRVRPVLDTWLKNPDHLIQRAARANGGVYDPELHLRQLGDRPVAVGGRSVEPRDLEGTAGASSGWCATGSSNERVRVHGECRPTWSISFAPGNARIHGTGSRSNG